MKVGGINDKLCNVLDNDLIIKFLLSNPRTEYSRDFISCERLHPARKTEKLKHIAQREIGDVRKLYPGMNKMNFCTRVLTYLLKAYLFIKQGDFFWLFNSIVKKVVTKLRFKG